MRWKEKHGGENYLAFEEESESVLFAVFVILVQEDSLKGAPFLL